jgi:hypothetical protein
MTVHFLKKNRKKIAMSIFFGFSKYRVGVGFGFFKNRDFGVDFDYSTHLYCLLWHVKIDKKMSLLIR